MHRDDNNKISVLSKIKGVFMAVKILLVDENKKLGDSVRETLKSCGYHVVEATDNEHAFSMLSSDKFDLILLDITLPKKSGLRILEYLREKQLTCTVIVITGSVELENEIKSKSLGVQDYISKPYNPNYLLMSIEHALSGGSQTNIKLQIIKAGDFIKSTPTGDLDMTASTEVLRQISVAGDYLEEYTVLIDLRDVKSHLSTTDIYKLVSELVKYGDTFQRKTAVLARDDKDLKQVTFFETIAQNRGYKIRAFTVFEDAARWLSSTTQLTEKSIG
jgi:DNA-binding response OmpR family regulator